MSIYSKIIDIQKLGQAWDRVKKNKPAPGVDNVTYEIAASITMPRIMANG